MGASSGLDRPEYTPPRSSRTSVMKTRTVPAVVAERGWMHNIAIDSKGNLYTSEVGTGRRAQKFARVD